MKTASGETTYGIFNADSILGRSMDPWELIEEWAPQEVADAAESELPLELYVGVMESFAPSDFISTDSFLARFRDRRLTADTVLDGIDDAYFTNLFADSDDSYEPPTLRDAETARREFRRVLRGARRIVGATRLEKDSRGWAGRARRGISRQEEAYEGLEQVVEEVAKWSDKYVAIQYPELCSGKVKPALPVALIGGEWRYGQSLVGCPEITALIDYQYDAETDEGTWKWIVPRNAAASATPLLGFTDSLQEAKAEVERTLGAPVHVTHPSMG